MAIAFVVGYNIELFFSLMDAAIKKVKEISQQASPAAEKENPPVIPQKDSDAPKQKKARSKKQAAKGSAG